MALIIDFAKIHISDRLFCLFGHKGLKAVVVVKHHYAYYATLTGIIGIDADYRH